jgi:hypothetical protein
MHLRSWSLSLLPLVVACGGNEPPARTAEVPPAPTVASVPAAPPGTRTASPELQALARASAQDSFAMYVDLEGFVRSDLARSLVPALVTMTGLQFPDWKDCVGRIVTHGRELAVGGDGSDDGASLVTLRLAAGTAHETLAACSSASGHPGVLSFDGADEGVGSSDRATLRRGDVLVIGNPDAIKKMLASKPRPWPTELALPPDSFLTALGSGDGASGHGQLTMNATKLLASAEVTLPSEEVAKQQTDGATAALKGGGDDDLKGLDPATKAVVAHVRQSIRIERKGKTVDLALDLEEGPAEQAKDVAGLASFALYGVRQYITQTKKIEAMVALRSIGVDYRQELDKQTGPKAAAKKRLHSFPAVPKEVPRGVRYQSTPADWKPWSAIFFEMDAPQYYQYEIKAAKDGRSADIIARGDLDGDGKTSEFKLHIVLDPKTGELSVPTLPVETDGDE